MRRILDRYVVRSFLAWYAISFFFFVGLFLVLDFFNRIDNFLEARETIREHGRTLAWTIAAYYIYNIPFIFVQIAPFITLMAASFSLTRLLKQNEIIPMINAGISLPRVLAPIFVLALVLTVAMIAAQEVLVPDLAWRRHSIERLADGDEPGLIDDIATLTDRDGSRVRIGAFDHAHLRIRDLDVTRFRPVAGTLQAKAAEYREGPMGTGWYLEEGVPRNFDDLGAEPRRQEFWETDITPEDILLAVDDKSSFSFRQLQAAYRRDPQKVGLLSLIHNRITFPLSNLILLLIGIPSLLSRGGRSRFLGIALTFLICGAFFGTDFVARTFGDRGMIHPIVAAWIPVTLFGSLGVVMIGGIRT